MLNKRTIIAFCVLLGSAPVFAQQRVAPIYNVTVVDRTTKAVNYQYRQGPTPIDFRGTVLMPQAKGQAMVESKRGHTEIDASFEHLTTPSAYGREYLTYTLWAITPEGAAHNLGEIVPGSSHKASLRVTTDLQAFGLIVTAEPYSAARLPSDVVVMENEIRPDTLGTIQPINVNYELMPRGHYTWHVPDQMDANVASMPKVSMSKYEEMLAIYEAQNAIGIAQAAGADTLAADTFRKAQVDLQNAQQLQASKASSKRVVQIAKGAEETAEDARAIAERRGRDAQLAKAKAEVTQAQQAQLAAQAETQKALADAQAARAQAEAERIAREKAEADARAAVEQQRVSSAARVIPPPPPPRRDDDSGKTDLRRRLNAQFNGVLPTRDTPRGLVVTVADSAFRGSSLKSPTRNQLSRVASILASHPGLAVEVEGYSGGGNGSGSARAAAVRSILLDQGLSPARVTSEGLGDERPVASNSTAQGREQNRRVEIVISGDAIGAHAAWDRAYSIAPNRSQPE